MSLAGIGYDSHRLAAGRRLILGGVEIPGELGLEGHSDADVLTHAVIDALLGAAGLGDIGEHFPDTDERWRDADSLGCLGCPRDARRGRHGDRQRRLHGCDGARRSSERTREAIRKRPGAGRSGLDAEACNVKASTGEGIGFVGRGEGVAALAIVSLQEG